MKKNRRKERQKDRQAGRQTDGQTDMQTDRQTDSGARTAPDVGEPGPEVLDDGQGGHDDGGPGKGEEQLRAEDGLVQLCSVWVLWSG